MPPDPDIDHAPFPCPEGKAYAHKGCGGLVEYTITAYGAESVCMKCGLRSTGMIHTGVLRTPEDCYLIDDPDVCAGDVEDGIAAAVAAAESNPTTKAMLERARKDACIETADHS